MKIFQIVNNFCHWEASRQFPTMEAIKQAYPTDQLLFVEAPDEVREGWGYLNGEFLKPQAPEGWLYDDETGTFYPEDYEPIRLSEKYESLCIAKIREKYTANDENQILREYLANQGDETKKQAFDEYNAYVEESLAAARKEVYGETEE